MVSVIKVFDRYCIVCYYQPKKLGNNLNYRYHLHDGKLRRSRIKLYLNDCKSLYLRIWFKYNLLYFTVVSKYGIWFKCVRLVGPFTYELLISSRNVFHFLKSHCELVYWLDHAVMSDSAAFNSCPYGHLAITETSRGYVA